MNIDLLLHDRRTLVTLGGFGVLVVAVFIWMALAGNGPSQARLKNVTDRRNELRAAERNKKVTRHDALAQMDIIKALVQKLKLAKGKQTNELRLKLARAGFRSTEAMTTYLLMRIVAPAGIGVMAFMLIFVAHAYNLNGIMKFVVLVAVTLFGAALPDIMLKNKAQKRSHVLQLAMPDGLDLLVICAEAGLSLDAALERVSREIAPSCPELGEEVGLTAVELGFLPDRSQALQNFSDRVPLQGVIGLVNTLIQTERYGTPLAQALRVLSSEMRDERIMSAEAKAAKLPATLTVPMILFILPPLFVVLLGPAILNVRDLMKH